MTDARVEARAGRVVAGAGAWPFALDCRSGAATLDLGERAVEVRPLRWREKVTLARFAFLGGEVMDEQVLRLSLPDGVVVPDGEARAAALALARWVNDPGEGSGTLPLEPPLLASVTLDVCAAIGLAPADLDARDAAEVEALWYAAGGDEARVAPAARRLARAPIVEQPRPGRGSPRQPEPSMRGPGLEVGEPTRIVIVPDEPSANPPAATHLTGGRGLDEPSPEPEPVEVEPVAVAPPPAPSVGQDVARALSPAPRFELSYGRPAARRSRATAATTPAPGAAVTERSTPDPVRGNVSRGSVGRGVRVAFAPATDATAAAAEAPALDDNALPAPAPVESTPLAVDIDEVIDELSERLGRAASELGVPQI